MLQPFGYGGEMRLSGLEDIKHYTAYFFHIICFLYTGLSTLMYKIGRAHV